ncbi:MAG: hypothetical protein AAF235_09515, partial [Planctomycetota bacterium]
QPLGKRTCAALHREPPEGAAAALSGGPAFVMDGALDDRAVDIGGSGSVRLYAAIEGTTLYVAATPPSGDRDRFIFIAGSPGPMTASPWAKAGQVAGWDAFLAGESTNDYAGWFDASSTEGPARGAVLEGTIDLAAELGLGGGLGGGLGDGSVSGGTLPGSVSIALGSFGTNDGGSLDPAGQAPGSINNDGWIDAAEYASVELCSLTSVGCCPADIDGDRSITMFDVLGFLEAAEAAPTAVEIVAFLGLADVGCR